MSGTSSSDAAGPREGDAANTETTASDVTRAVAAQVGEPASELAVQDCDDGDWSGACVVPVNLTEVESKDTKEKQMVCMAMLARDKATGKFTVLGGRKDDTDDTPLETACRECWEETCGSVEVSYDLFRRNMHELYESGDQLLMTYTATKKPYHCYITPCELSEAVLGMFNDRVREHERTGKIKALGHLSEGELEHYVEKDVLVWAPIAHALKDTKNVSWFTRQILKEIVVKFNKRGPDAERPPEREPAHASGT